MFNAIKTRGFNAAAGFGRTQFLKTSSNMMPMQASFFKMQPTRMFSSVAHSTSDDLSEMPRISLEEFYSTVANFTISDEEALEYMNFAAKMAMVTFKD